jgi:hypothetical protein
MVHDGLSVRAEDIRVGFIGPQRNSLIRAVIIQSMIERPYRFFSRSSPSFKPALNLLAYQWFFTAVASNSHGLNQHASVFCFVYYPRPLLIYLLLALLSLFALSTTFLCSMCVDPRTRMYHEDGWMKQSIPPAPHQEDGSPTISLL